MHRGIHISGLVKIARQVRGVLCLPPTNPHRHELPARIDRALAELDRILHEHGMSPGHLPAPSRRAYEFLLEARRLAAAQVNPQDAAAPFALPGEMPVAPLPGSIRFPRLARQLAVIRDMVAIDPSQRCRDEVLPLLTGSVEAIDDILESKRAGDEHLDLRARETLAWAKYFAQPQHLDEYVSAVRRLKSYVDYAAFAHFRWKSPLLAGFEPMRSMSRWRVVSHGTELRLPTPMIYLDDAQTRALLGMIRRQPGCERIVTTAMQSPAYQAAASAIQGEGGSAGAARGIAHDLNESFDRVNREYFVGAMSRPRLSWSRSAMSRVFGRYDFAGDTVWINILLDRPDVPGYVVDHVMHHELLHKKHGIRWQSGRQHFHTPAFRDEERAFARYEEADRFLRGLAGQK